MTVSSACHHACTAPRNPNSHRRTHSAVTEQARREFSEYEAARKEFHEQALARSPPRKTVPLLEVDYHAVVAANVQRERDSMVPVIC